MESGKTSQRVVGPLREGSAQPADLGRSDGDTTADLGHTALEPAALRFEGLGRARLGSHAVPRRLTPPSVGRAHPISSRAKMPRRWSKRSWPPGPTMSSQVRRTIRHPAARRFV